MTKILSVLLASFLIACSTHQVNLKTTNDIRSYGNEIVVRVSGEDAIADKLRRALQAEFLKLGFNLADTSDTRAISLVVTVSEFSPGNQALRLTIGLGAGRGSLVYNAQYKKGDEVLINYDGEERFTGMEVAPGTKHRWAGNFAGEGTATEILIEEAVDHIVNIALK